MSYAVPADVESRLVGRTLDEQEAEVIQTRLDDVEELIRLRIPDLDDKVALGEIRERLIVMVEAEAVLRLIRNPEGLTQETDGNYSYSISSRVSSGVLEILPEEWRLLGVRSSVALIMTQIMMPLPTAHEANPNGDFEPDTAVWA